MIETETVLTDEGRVAVSELADVAKFFTKTQQIAEPRLTPAAEELAPVIPTQPADCHVAAVE